MKKLTQKQLRFAQGYLETGSKVEAYWRAYDCSGMNDRTIQRKALEVAALPHVAAKIFALQEAAAERSKVVTDDVLREYIEIAFHTSIADFIDIKEPGVSRG